jgi:hypothetical protein
MPVPSIKLAVLILLTIAIFYGITVSNGFVLDDWPVVVDNPYVQSLRHLPRAITGCIWEAQLGTCQGTTLHYRPWHTLSYLLTWQISSQPWAFHLVNLAYLAVTAYLIYAVIVLITGRLSVAALTTLIFITHPINSEAINWVSAVSELAMATFIMLSIWAYLQYHRQSDKRYYYLTLISYGFAMLAKEPAFGIVPALILMIDALVHKKSFTDLTNRPQLKQYAGFAVPVIVYLLLRQIAIRSAAGLALTDSYLGALPLTDRLIQIVSLLGQYAEAIIAPHPLTFIHPVISGSFASPAFIIGFATLIIAVAAGIILYRRGRIMYVVALAWFLIALLPSLVFSKVAGYSFFAERYLLVPSIGAALLASLLLLALWQEKTLAKLITITVLTAYLVSSWLIIQQRNGTWRDNETFSQANLALNPSAHNLRLHLARELNRQDKVADAQREYQSIIDSVNVPDSDRQEAYHGLANSYRSTGNNRQASQVLQQSIDQGVSDYRIYNNLAVLELEQGNNLGGLIAFCQAAELAPLAPEVQQNYERINNLFIKLRQQNPLALYQQITAGFWAVKSNHLTTADDINCNTESCQYSLAIPQAQTDILLPFLFFATTPDGTLIVVEQSRFSPQVDRIEALLSNQYQSLDLSFVLPTCFDFIR